MSYYQEDDEYDVFDNDQPKTPWWSYIVIALTAVGIIAFASWLNGL